MWCSQVTQGQVVAMVAKKILYESCPRVLYKYQNCTGCNVHNFQVVAIVADHLHLRRHRDRNVTSPRAKDHWCLYFVPLSVTNFVIIIIITNITIIAIITNIIIITIMWGKYGNAILNSACRWPEISLLLIINLFVPAFYPALAIVWIHLSMVPSKTRWQKVNILQAQEII